MRLDQGRIDYGPGDEITWGPCDRRAFDPRWDYEEDDSTGEEYEDGQEDE